MIKEGLKKSNNRGIGESEVREININTRQAVFYFLAYCLFIVMTKLLEGYISVSTLSAVKFTVYVVLFVTGIVLFRQVISNSWGMMKRSILRNLLLLIGLYVGYALLSGLIYYYLSSPVDATGINDQKIYQIMATLPPYITLPILGVMGPVVEELIYRHLLIYRLSKEAGTWQCVLLSSLLFGLLHIHSLADLSNIFPYIIMGLVLGTLYVKSRYNLLLPIIFHVFNNLSGLIPFILN